MNQREEDFKRGWNAALSGVSANHCFTYDQLAGYDAAHYHHPDVSDENRDAIMGEHIRRTAPPSASHVPIAEPDGDIVWA